MAVDIVMPQMGESIFEGTITKWLKKPGDKVERDEPLFEISTDKVDAEIPSPSAGVLKEIKVGEGKTVPIQTVVGVIDAAGCSADLQLRRPLRKPLNLRSLLRPQRNKPRSPPPLRRPLQNPLPRHPPRKPLPLAKARAFIAHRSFAAWRKNTASTSRRYKAPARAAASASKTSKRISPAAAPEPKP